MTVSYTSKVATAKKLGIFWKLLFRWRGSIYKLIWPEMLVFIFLYAGLRCIYDFALNVEQRNTFEEISLYCQTFTDMIPLTFVLGFYVNIVMTRWWDQYKTIPWPDNLAVFVSTSVHGLDERGRLMRRSIMRYVNLSFVITMSMISPRVKKRFPTKEHLVEAGFMTKNEMDIFDKLDEMFPQPKYWMPLVWAGTIVSRARKEGRIRDDLGVKTILDTINLFRSGLGGLLGYDRISVPLVYTQVVTMAVYTFFMGTLMSRQYLDTTKGYPKNTVDLYVPWFSILQFLFYMGWLKVAESLINPFGEDDDDFEINSLIDRNIQLSYLVVDGMHSEHPDLVQDKYWDEVIPQDLPYTVAAEQYRIGPHLGSTANMDIPKSEQPFLLRMAMLEEEDAADEEMGSQLYMKPFNKDSDAKDGVDSDGESVVWVTPRSMPRNQSILSLLRAQFGGNPSHHRVLTKQSSNASSIIAARKVDQKPQGSSNLTPNQQRRKSARQISDKLGGSTIFHLSLESLKEGDSKNGNETIEEGESLISEEEEKRENENKEQKGKLEIQTAAEVQLQPPLEEPQSELLLEIQQDPLLQSGSQSKS